MGESAQRVVDLDNAALLFLSKKEEGQQRGHISQLDAAKLLGKITLQVDQNGDALNYTIPKHAMLDAGLSAEYWTKAVMKGLMYYREEQDSFEMPITVELQGITVRNSLLERLEKLAGIKYEQARNRYDSLSKEMTKPKTIG